MEFVDNTPQPELSEGINNDQTYEVSDYHDADLANFLSRPVRIAVLDWSYNTLVQGGFNPWTNYFNDTRIKNRLAYYNLLRCKLCVKFVINGNQFQYGKMMFDYHPLANYTIDGSSWSDTMTYTTTTNGTLYPVAASQRQHVMLEPLNSKGACMELPFFWPQNWLSIPLEQWTMMGYLRYHSLNLLRHANDSSAVDTPRISVFAWAEDVQLGVPTAAPPATLLPQAGDEVIGSISGPASALSDAVSVLNNIPVIGNYARATSMVASGIGAMAKTFGFSRPPIETPITMVKPDYGGNLANTDRPEYINKLTVDSSQEVTLDPSVTGFDMGDEMTIASIASRETFLTQFQWSYTDIPDSILWGTKVSPMLGAINASYTTTRCMIPTALMFASIPFKYWRGSLKFRFEVVCSGFHKGRVRIVYDPATQPQVGNFNQNYSVVLDLEEEQSIEVTVNWGNPSVALETGTGTSIFTLQKYSAVSAQTPDPMYDNGALTFIVLNTLSVPNRTITAAQSAVYVNVYVSAGDDFELSVPSVEGLTALTTKPAFLPAAGLEPITKYEVGLPNPTANRNLVLFGETIVSFRALLKRYGAYMTLGMLLSNTLAATFRAKVRRYPLHAGNDGSGLNTISNKLGAGTYAGNDFNTTLYQYISSAYSAMRGSIRYKYNFYKPNATSMSDYLVVINRSNSTNSTQFVNVTATALASQTVDTLAATSKALGSTYSGAVVVRPGYNPLVEFEDPYLDRYRFFNPKSLTANDEVTGGHLVIVHSTYSNASNDWLVAQSYIATGEDFNLVNYTGPPQLWSSAYY